MQQSGSPFGNSPVIAHAWAECPASDGLPAMPAFCRDLHKAAPNDQDAIIFWSGVWRRGSTTHGWGTFRWCTRHNGKTDHAAASVDASVVERLLAPLAHEARIRLMQAMHDGARTSGELSEATGLRGGNLYYHLRELLHAAYIQDDGGRYDLTGLGCQLLLTVTHIAEGVSDRLDQGEPVFGHGI